MYSCNNRLFGNLKLFRFENKSSLPCCAMPPGFEQLFPILYPNDLDEKIYLIAVSENYLN